MGAVVVRADEAMLGYTPYYKMRRVKSFVNVYLMKNQTRILTSLLVLGDVEPGDEAWNLISGYRRTTVDLPSNLLDSIQEVSKQRDMTMSEYIEEAIRRNMDREETI